MALHPKRTKYETTGLRFALAAEAQSANTFPLKLKTRFKSSGKDMLGGVLRPYGAGSSGKIERIEDAITLQALSPLEPREAATYRLLISWSGRNDGKADESGSKTFAVPLVFYQRLGWIGAAIIIFAQFFVLFF